jgi:hypothetical protein
MASLLRATSISEMFHVGCLISVWSDKLTITKQRSRSRVALSRVTLFKG